MRMQDFVSLEATGPALYGGYFLDHVVTPIYEVRCAELTKVTKPLKRPVPFFTKLVFLSTQPTSETRCHFF